MARKPRMTLHGHDLSIDLIADLPDNPDDGLCVYCAEDHKLYVYDSEAEAWYVSAALTLVT